MTGMWRRWARRRRIIGLAFLGSAAVAIAVAVLLWFHASGPFTGLFVGTAIGAAVALLILTCIEFARAHKYTRLGRAHG